MRCAAMAGVLAILSGPSWSADLARQTRPDIASTFSPTSPIGVASELPRSPLADEIVNGSIRFSSASEAQAHCPDDRIVKVKTWSNVYYSARSPIDGAYMCQAGASAEGDRPR